MEAMNTSVHTLIRNEFTLELSLDEDDGTFTCVCRPAPNDRVLPEIKQAFTRWTRQVAYGWVRRQNGGRGVADIQWGGRFSQHGSGIRGTFTAVNKEGKPQ